MAYVTGKLKKSLPGFKEGETVQIIESYLGVGKEPRHIIKSFIRVDADGDVAHSEITINNIAGNRKPCV